MSDWPVTSGSATMVERLRYFGGVLARSETTTVAWLLYSVFFSFLLSFFKTCMEYGIVGLVVALIICSIM